MSHTAHEDGAAGRRPASRVPRHFKSSRATRWLALLMSPMVVMLATPAYSQAEESNPNNYQCAGHVTAGKPEAGSTEAQVAYTISCSGPISGYELQTQAPITGFESAPLVTNEAGLPVTTDSFSCDGEIPGYAVNCVGSTTQGYETIAGQFALGRKLCAEPRIEPKLTVTYAYLNEKKAITQAISGPFDLGRPRGCPVVAHRSRAAGKGTGKTRAGSQKTPKGKSRGRSKKKQG
jgi:hypothetical protein